nr:mitochondrial import inner membrane translocase subunit tim23-1 [Quercus suber]
MDLLCQKEILVNYLGDSNKATSAVSNLNTEILWFDMNSDYKRIYPYQGIQVSIPVRNIYQLPTAPQYLFDEEARRSRRNLSDNLTFFTGCGYLLGALGGGASGLIAGVKSFKPGDTAKLRANWVLQPSDLGFLEMGLLGLRCVFLG